MLSLFVCESPSVQVLGCMLEVGGYAQHSIADKRKITIDNRRTVTLEQQQQQ